MKQKKLKLCGVLFFGLGLIAHAQETLTTSGGSGTGNGGSVSFTIGQTVYTTNSSTSSSVAQGVQQPYEISVASELIKVPNLTLTCSVFPNPATNALVLKIEDITHMQYMASLYDLKGSLLVTQKITTNETVITINNYAPATYLLKITQLQGTGTPQEVKTFKIIKAN